MKEHNLLIFEQGSLEFFPNSKIKSVQRNKKTLPQNKQVSRKDLNKLTDIAFGYTLYF